MLKRNKVVMRHLLDIKQAFLSCEQEKLGLISSSIFQQKLHALNQKFSEGFQKYLVEVFTDDTQTDYLEDGSEEKFVSYSRLVGVLDIFM